MSFSCKNELHSEYPLTMVCVDKQCNSNGIICHYCLYENHKGHIVMPTEIFHKSFLDAFSTEKNNFETENLKSSLRKFIGIKDKYIRQIADFENSILSFITEMRRKIDSIFDSQSSLHFINKATQILKTEEELLFKQKPSSNLELENLFKYCLNIMPRDFGDISDSLKFEMKSITNAINLSFTRMEAFESKFTKVIQKNFKSLENDFQFVLNQLSISSIEQIKHVPEPEKNVLEGHKNDIRQIVSLGNLNNVPLIGSCSQDGQIRIWNYLRNKCLAVLTGHKGQIYDLIYIEKKRFLISASQDHTIKVWNVGSWKCLKTLYGNEGWVGHLVFNQKMNLLSSAGSDRKIRLWNIEDGSCQKISFSTESEIFSLENGEWEKQLKIIAGDIRGKIYLFNYSNNLSQLEKKINAHNDKILRLKYYKSISKGKKLLISCSNDKTMKVWNAKTLEMLKNLEIHTNFVTDFFFDEKNEILLSCSFDNTIKMTCLKNYDVIATWRVNTHLIKILWIPFSNLICYSSTSNNDFGLNMLYF